MIKISKDLSNALQEHTTAAWDILDGTEHRENFTSLLQGLQNGLPLRIALEILTQKASRCDCIGANPAWPDRDKFAKAASHYWECVSILIQLRLKHQFDRQL